MTLENATLTGAAPAAKGAKPGKGDKPGQLTIQATLQTYRYMEEGGVPAGGGQQQGKGAAKK